MFSRLTYLVLLPIVLLRVSIDAAHALDGLVPGAGMLVWLIDTVVLHRFWLLPLTADLIRLLSDNASHRRRTVPVRANHPHAR